MSMHPAVIVTTSLVSEVVKTVSAVAEHNREIHAINTQLAIAEQHHKRELKQIKAEAKQNSQKIKAEKGAFKMNMKSLNKDKKSIRQQLELCTQQAINFSLTVEERAEAREMAIFLSNQLDAMSHNQLRSQAQLGDNLSRIVSFSGGRVIDVDFKER